MGSVRAARFMQYLPEMGWKPVVITPQDGMYHRPRRGWAPPSGTQVVRTATFELSRVFRSIHRRMGRADTSPDEIVAPVEAGRLGSALRSLLREIVYVPDAQIGWLPFALRASAAAVRQQAPDVVYTTSVPFTSHLVGRILKRRTGTAWVAEFRDLWTGSQAGEARTHLRRGINRRLEANIVKAADAVVVTTPAARQILAGSCPGADPDRIHVVTNAFDASAHPVPIPPKPGASLLLIHAGTLLPELQDPAPLLAGAAVLERECPGSLRIRVFGPSEPWSSARARAGCPEHLLELRGLVSPSRIPAELAQASAILLLAPGASFRAVYLGKMFEWLGAGVPALAVVDADGIMADVIRRSRGGIIAPANEANVIERALRSLLLEHRHGSLGSMAPDPGVIAEFEARNVTRQLAAVFGAAVQRAQSKVPSA
jgi:hypothetical protein